MNNSEPYIVVVWGDSIAAAGWPALAETAFNVILNTGRPIKVINKGVSGMPASVARTQFETDIMSQSPNLVIMQFGFNDMRHDGTRGEMPLSTPEEFEEHLLQMVRLCREKAGAKVILYGNHKARRLEIMPTGVPYDAARAAYNQVTKRVAEKMGVPYRDMSETFAEAGEHFSAVLCEDGVHLSPFGLNAYGSVAAMDIRRTMHTG